MRLRYMVSLAVLALVVLASCGQRATSGPDPRTLWPLSALSPAPTPGESTPSLLTSDEAVRNGILLKTGGPPPLVQWSPDGDAILFGYGFEHGGGRLGLKAINSDGSALREIANAVDFLGEWGYVQHITHADIAQSGRQIVFTTWDLNSYSYSYTLAPDTQPIRPQLPYFREPLEGRRCPELLRSNTGVWHWSIAKCFSPYAHYFPTEALAVANIDGTGTRSLHVGYHGPRRNASPAWSPDGRQIAAFLRGKEGRYLAVMDPDLSQVRRISLIDAAREFSIAWSPDGQHIAFVAKHRQFDPPALGVYTVRHDGSEPTVVSETLSAPAWSPDGKRIALVKIHEDRWPSDNNGPVVLVTMEADGSNPREIAKTGIRWEFFQKPEPWVRSLSWSPDGEHILFSCDAGICVVDLDGNMVGQSPHRLVGQKAAWSPDGSRIALCNDLRMHPSFESSPDRLAPEGTPLLYTMAPDGSDVQVLVSIGKNNSLVAENS